MLWYPWCSTQLLLGIYGERTNAVSRMKSYPLSPVQQINTELSFCGQSTLHSTTHLIHPSELEAVLLIVEGAL